MMVMEQVPIQYGTQRFGPLISPDEPENVFGLSQPSEEFRRVSKAGLLAAGIAGAAFGIVGALFNYGVAKESKSKMVKVTGNILAYTGFASVAGMLLLGIAGAALLPTWVNQAAQQAGVPGGVPKPTYSV